MPRATRRRRRKTPRRRRQSRRRGGDSTTKATKFIAFGCWNSGGCDPNSTAPNELTRTMQRLQQYSASTPQDFMVVMGDNYYASKKTVKLPNGQKQKTKTFVPEDLASGFSCLHNVSIPKKYILLGNHEMEKIPGISGCPVLIAQIRETRDPSYVFSSPNPEEFPHKIVEQTLLLFFDTNPYEKDADMAECYEVFAGTTMQEIMQRQARQVRELVARPEVVGNIHNVVFMAHHPIFSVKYKPDRPEKIKTEVAPDFVELLQEICTALPGRVFFHICADVHQLQVGVVQLPSGAEIKQVVVGTDGAERDETVPFDLWSLDEQGVGYQIEISESVNGFLECETSEANLLLKFIYTDVERPVFPL